MPNEFEMLKKEVKLLRSIVNQIVQNDAYIFNKNIGVGGDKHIIFDKETGSNLGMTNTEKFALWGATPIVRPNLSTAAPVRTASYSQSEAQDVTDAINEIRGDLISFGFYPIS